MRISSPPCVLHAPAVLYSWHFCRMTSSFKFECFLRYLKTMQFRGEGTVIECVNTWRLSAGKGSPQDKGVWLLTCVTSLLFHIQIRMGLFGFGSSIFFPPPPFFNLPVLQAVVICTVICITGILVQEWCHQQELLWLCQWRTGKKKRHGNWISLLQLVFITIILL
jgi:hypothetical protein